MKLEVGSHIKVRRLEGAYYHHGICVGDGQVIHFSGELACNKDATIGWDSLDTLAFTTARDVIGTLQLQGMVSR